MEKNRYTNFMRTVIEISFRQFDRKRRYNTGLFIINYRYRRSGAEPSLVARTIKSMAQKMRIRISIKFHNLLRLTRKMVLRKGADKFTFLNTGEQIKALTPYVLLTQHLNFEGYFLSNGCCILGPNIFTKGRARFIQPHPTQLKFCFLFVAKTYFSPRFHRGLKIVR